MVGTRNKGVSNISYKGGHISSVADKSKQIQAKISVSKASDNVEPWKKVPVAAKKRSSSSSAILKGDTNTFEFLADEGDSSPCKMCNEMVTLQQKGIQCYK